jgi:hypothetical protein
MAVRPAGLVVRYCLIRHDGGTDYTAVRNIRTRLDQTAVSRANGEVDMYQVHVYDIYQDQHLNTWIGGTMYPVKVLGG